MKTKLNKNKLLSILFIAACIGLLLWRFSGAKEASPVQDAGTQQSTVSESGSTTQEETLAIEETPALTIFEAEEENIQKPGQADREDSSAPPVSTETQSSSSSQESTDLDEKKAGITEDGLYTKKEDVALYIHLYGHLPDNFITKSQARALGWGDSYSSVDDAAPGKSIGGDRFGNREGLLPKKKGRTYTECDIGTMGKKSRGAKRIVFSNDGLVYYTGDHYETFELLYGDE